MGGSTNTVLHTLAIAREAGIPYDIARIDDISRRIPCLCKVSPSSNYHVQDVHRAGGIHTILGELKRHGRAEHRCITVTGKTIGENIDEWDVRSEQCSRLGQSRARLRRLGHRGGSERQDGHGGPHRERQSRAQADAVFPRRPTGHHALARCRRVQRRRRCEAQLALFADDAELTAARRQRAARPRRDRRRHRKHKLRKSKGLVRAELGDAQRHAGDRSSGTTPRARRK